MAGGGYVFAQALNLGFYIVLARLATPADFGELAAGTILIGIAGLVTESGMMSALVHRRDRVEEAAATAVFSTAAAGLALGLGALALSPLIGLFFDSDTVGAVAAAVSGIILLQALTIVPAAIMQRRFNYVRRVVIEPARTVAFGVVAIIATSDGMGVWGLVLGLYAGIACDLVLSWGLSRWRPELRLATMEMWRELVAYGRHVFAAAVILRIGEQADTLWLGRFLGTAPLGQYRYAFRLASTPYWTLVSGASYVLFPVFARIATETERFEAAFMRALRWTCIVGFPAGMLLVPLGEPLAVLLFGEVWRQAGFAAMAMGVYTATSCISAVSSEGLKAHGRPDVLTRMHSVTTFSSVVLMGALLPLGVVGVAGGLSIGAALGAAYAIRAVERAIGFPVADMLGVLKAPAIAAVVAAAVIAPVEHLILDAAGRSTAEGLALLTVEGLAGIGIFILVLKALAPGIGSELRDIRSHLGREEAEEAPA